MAKKRQQNNSGFKKVENPLLRLELLHMQAKAQTIQQRISEIDQKLRSALDEPQDFKEDIQE